MLEKTIKTYHTHVLVFGISGIVLNEEHSVARKWKNKIQEWQATLSVIEGRGYSLWLIFRLRL